MKNYESIESLIYMASNKEFLAEIDWNSVRGIYKKLSDEFHVLTEPFKVQLSNELKLQLDHLIIAIDGVDNTLDELAAAAVRNSLSSEMIEFLSDNRSIFSHPQAEDTLRGKLNTLKIILSQIDNKSGFIQATKDILNFTELKRHTTDPNQLIELVVKEGTATAQLPLSILIDSSTHEFRSFFTQLCELMGIVDLIFDLRSDYNNKLISIKPSLNLYLRLIRISASRGLRLIRAFPKKLSFLKYCTKFGYVLMTEWRQALLNRHDVFLLSG